MVSRSYGIIAASALGASAFLIPAGVAPAGNDLTLSLYNNKNQLVRLPCSACVFPSSERNSEEKFHKVDEEFDLDFWIQGGANDVLLNFTISEQQSLEVNGHTIYPFGDLLGVFVDPSRVFQVSASASQEDIKNGDARLTSLEVTSAALAIDEHHEISPAGDYIDSLRYSILGIESNAIALDDVVIDLLHTADGELLIMDTHSEPNAIAELISSPFPAPFPQPAPTSQNEDASISDCGSLPEFVCRMKGFIDSKVSDLKTFAHGKKPGCGNRRPWGGKLPTHIKPGFLRPDFHHLPESGEKEAFDAHDMPPPHPHGGRPGHARPHHRHGHHHHHSFLRSFARGLIAVVIPTLIGVAVGMLISIVGLLVGRFIGFIWVKFVRGKRQGYTGLAQESSEDLEPGIDGGKAALAQDEIHEAPPVYEDAPAYEEYAETKEPKE